MAASLLRLQFHDCMVEVCDASVLLDVPMGERIFAPNLASARGFEVIDASKLEVENLYLGIVSCAFILAIVTRNAVVMVGGPFWTVKNGRRDSTNGSSLLADTSIPGRDSSLDLLISKLSEKGLTTWDLVALPGAHTIGRAQCRRDSTNGSSLPTDTSIPGRDSSLDLLIAKFAEKGLTTFDLVALPGAHTIGRFPYPTPVAHLDLRFYVTTCPGFNVLVFNSIAKEILVLLRMAASLLHLQFHDCMVQGCDASVLLDLPGGERTVAPNLASARGFEVIDAIKIEVENLCLGIVSCVDILAIVTRNAVVMVGGPFWTVKNGRRDSTNGSIFLSDTSIPGRDSSLDLFIAKFSEKGLTTWDLVALPGAHSIGRAQCRFLRNLKNLPTVVSVLLRLAALLLRLQFHDCIVQGCDTSVLLDVPEVKEPSPLIWLRLGDSR
ncbi:hypothetical protein L1987_80921 [Smallanthus sonchifolius]|uniref:Uncharacterized protein n=1 Tax=Smallanthus sonchifolius TaxID=185202 RepID=A0ACB8YP01_9ASTR|nr:hypothetical protein L1987_80921 [Smallanthus sonchifolius]